MKRYFNCVDVFKLVMAFLVVGIHAGVPSLFADDFWGHVATFPFRTAVPFFFVVSGFFLGRKVQRDKTNRLKTINGWCRKNAQMYLVWTIIFLPLTIIGFKADSLPIVKSIAFFLRNVVLVGENYMSWPLWYLLALVVAGLILYFFEKKNVPLIWQLAIAAALYAIGLLINSVISTPTSSALVNKTVAVYFKIFNSTKNGLFVGLLFVELGYVFSAIAPKTIGSSHQLRGAVICRQMSTVIYLVHMYFIAAIRLMVCPTMSQLLQFLWAAGLSALIALIVSSLPANKVRKLLFNF